MQPQRKDRILNMRIMDDLLGGLILAHTDAFNEVWKTVTGFQSHVVEIITQKEIKSTTGKAIQCDIFAKDENGDIYLIELQRKSKDWPLKRTRYYLGAIANHTLKPGDLYDDAPNVHMIVIFENAIDKCHGKQVFIEDNRKSSGTYVAYIDASYNTNNELSSLMSDLFQSDYLKMNNKTLANWMKFYKTKGGLEVLDRELTKCEEQIIHEEKIEMARRMLVDNMSMELIAKYTELSIEEIQVLAKNIE